ncbi:hypothetical protein Ddc_10194 [Ditylenchus destructor]|nr:hypothetical protein Ddc_10194 [Ditylenchus destructor]
MTSHTQASKLYMKAKLGFKKLVSYDLNDPEEPENPADVKVRLQKMELLEKKLKVQRNICAFGVVLTVTVYFLFWYFSDCWALPFQESPCKQPRTLPLLATNQSTLAETVDEFVTRYNLAVEMVDLILAERHALFNTAKNDISQLLSQHSADLRAFGAVKREDERLEYVEDEIGKSHLFVLMFLVGFMMITGSLIEEIKKSTHSGMDNKEVVAEEMKSSQNARLKKLKRRIPLLYAVTFICIAVELALFFVFLAGIYYGNAPAYRDAKHNTIESCKEQKNCKEKESFSDYVSFLTQLNSSMQESSVGIKTSLSSSILEVRQSVWHYESKAIATAIDHYYDLKQYHVDRRTMPRAIGIVLPEPILYFIVIPILFINFVIFVVWATAEGSVWEYNVAVTSFHRLTQGEVYSFPNEEGILYMWNDEDTLAVGKKYVIGEEHLHLAIQEALKKKIFAYVFDLGDVAKNLVHKKKVRADTLEVMAKMTGVKYEVKAGKVRVTKGSVKEDGIVYDVKTKLSGKDAIKAAMKLHTLLGQHVLDRAEKISETVRDLEAEDKKDKNMSYIEQLKGEMEKLQKMLRLVEHSLVELTLYNIEHFVGTK